MEYHGRGLRGALAHLREHLDANWHGNYNAARQRWQGRRGASVVATDDDRAGPTKSRGSCTRAGPCGSTSELV